MKSLLVLAVVVHTAVAQNTPMSAYTPYVIGNAGSGYSFATEDGSGNIIVATSQYDEHQAIFMKTPSMKNGEPAGPLSAQYPIPIAKGGVVDGCMLQQNGKQYLYAIMSKPGFIAKLDTDFAEPLQFLNATSEAIWGTGPIQALSSIVCDGQYVYVGTSAASSAVSTTILRLDTLNTNSKTRFTAMEAFGDGDIVFGSTFGDKFVFVSTPPNSPSPILYTFDSTFNKDSVATYPTTGLDHFTSLAGFYADAASKKVVLVNGMGTGRVALVDMSISSVPYTNITLSDGPVTSFVADPDSNVLYMTVGDCTTADDTVFVALRFAPELAVMNTSATAGSGYNCFTQGLPSSAVLIKSTGCNKAHVVTQVDGTAAGTILPFEVYPAGECSGNGAQCSGNGACAGMICACDPAWSGATCSDPVPCGGSHCSGTGYCSNDVCVCDLGWRGDDCSIAVPCPADCTNRGNCVNDVCECNSGFTGVACELVAAGCETLGDCNLHGTCEEGYPVGKCICDPGFTGEDCTDADTSCEGNCSGNGVCSNGTCTCNYGWTGATCATLAHNCPSNCSGHGTCSNGVCSCDDGFTGADCSTADPSFCPSGCNGHGSCVDQVCVCSPGYTGPTCASQEADLRVAETAIFAAGENKASSAFTLSVAASEVVFCVSSTPGKAIALDMDTLQRIRASTFEDQVVDTTLLQVGEGKASPRHDARAPKALVPEYPTGGVSSVALLEVGTGLTADMGDAPISVAVVEDSLNGFAILGTKAEGDVAMRGQLMKVSAATMQRTAQREFDDDTGSGVTAGVNAGDGIFYFASGNSPAMIYRVDSSLEILSKTPQDEGPPTEVVELLFDDGVLLAITKNTVYFYTIGADGTISPSEIRPSMAVPGSLGSMTTAMVHKAGGKSVAVIATDAGTPYALKVDMKTLNMTGPAVSMSTPTGTSSVVAYGDYAYFGHKSTGTTAYVSKFLVSSFVEIDTVEVPDCTDDLVSATISADGLHAYFGSAGTPAHVFKLRLFARDDCPDNCNGRGTCVMGTCSCEVGWAGDACGSKVPECPNNCSQVGTCSNGKCTCPSGYFKDDCSLVAKCDDTCAHGKCKGAPGADGKATWPCQCNSKAWTGDFCDEQAEFCPADCNTDKEQGNCDVDQGVCICNRGFKGDDCGTPIFPGDVLGCMLNSDCGTHGLCNLDKSTGVGTCVCSPGWEGPDCDVDSAFRAALETSKISPGLIAVMVAAAALVGMVAGVSIWKSWMVASGGVAGGAALAGAGSSGYAAGAAAGGGAAYAANTPAVPAGAGASYTRLPRRLVK